VNGLVGGLLTELRAYNVTVYGARFATSQSICQSRTAGSALHGQCKEASLIIPFG